MSGTPSGGDDYFNCKSVFRNASCTSLAAHTPRRMATKGALQTDIGAARTLLSKLDAPWQDAAGARVVFFSLW